MTIDAVEIHCDHAPAEPVAPTKSPALWCARCGALKRANESWCRPQRSFVDFKAQPQPAATQLQRPTIGRIVHYRLGTPLMCANGRRLPAGHIFPAIVIESQETCCALKCFLPTRGGPLFVPEAEFGEEPGQWSWPPRV